MTDVSDGVQNQFAALAGKRPGFFIQPSVPAGPETLATIFPNENDETEAVICQLFLSGFLTCWLSGLFQDFRDLDETSQKF